ncbi:MAG: helix-turn-helix domain-containing protein [Armatimonadota bacterium]
MKSEVVLSEEQLKCLASPVRADVFETLKSKGRVSARELSTSMGMSAQTIYFHLNELLKVELVEVVERRAATKRPENVFAATALSYRFPEGQPDIEHLVLKSISATLRRVMRNFESHAHDSENAQILRTVICLSEEDLSIFKKMIFDALEFARDQRDDNATPRDFTMLLHRRD